MSIKWKTINVWTILGFLVLVLVVTNIIAMSVQNTNALTIVSAIGPVKYYKNNQSHYYDTFLKINGPGYFIVRDPDSDTLYVTRNGTFEIGAHGFIVCANSFRLQGITNLVSNAIGDLTLTKRSIEDRYEGVTYISINIDTNGIITEISNHTSSLSE
jgi:flagellar basal body rod protein FlgG